MAQNTTVLHRDEVTSLNYLVETTSLPTMRVLNRILLNRCAPRTLPRSATTQCRHTCTS